MARKIRIHTMSGANHTYVNYNSWEIDGKTIAIFGIGFPSPGENIYFPLCNVESFSVEVKDD